jgi:hypothetical protein
VFIRHPEDTQRYPEGTHAATISLAAKAKEIATVIIGMGEEFWLPDQVRDVLERLG